MPSDSVNYKDVCEKLLRAETEGDITAILHDQGLLDPRHWKPLGEMPNNRSMVNNQAQDPAGALVEKVINSIDSMLIKMSFLKKTPPDSPEAPKTMAAAAAEEFLGIPDGNLANLTARELTRLADNIQIVATGSKSEPNYLVIDKGEGQTPVRFKETFLSLIRTNKARIPFVQGKFNCGGTGVLPFCGKSGYELIISRRCPELPSSPSEPDVNDSTHDKWGFTVIRKILPSSGLYDTTVYVYLAPHDQVPYFEAPEILALPTVSDESIAEDPDWDDGESQQSQNKSNDKTPTPYQMGLQYGTVIKLFNYKWRARSIATRDARYELERYLYQLSLPVRVIETRSGFKAHYYATTVAGTSATISKDREKGYLEDIPSGGVLHHEGLGTVPVSVTLYKERVGNDKTAKNPKRIAKGLLFTINGQVHFSMGPEFFVSRGLNFEFIKGTLLTTVDCTGLNEDIRDQLIMPSRDRLRKIPELEELVESIVADLKDRDVLRQIDYERRLRRTKEALRQDAVDDIFQSLINKDPVFASLFKNGKSLKNPFEPGGRDTKPTYKGKLPPTYFQFENGKNRIQKSFALDRTCAIELETDAINDYFELPNPDDRGELSIEPGYFERWILWNGRLRVVFRAPTNARIGDSAEVSIVVRDPKRTIRQDPPWVNSVNLTFTEGGMEVKPGGSRRKERDSGLVGYPRIQPVHKDKWDEHDFNERSALRICKEDNGYLFFVNMDNMYLQNELMRRKEPEKEVAKFAFQWGIVLIALGMLQELRKREGEKKATGEADDNENGDSSNGSAEETVSRFSAGVAAVIIPTVLNLMEVMEVKQREVPLTVN